MPDSEPVQARFAAIAGVLAAREGVTVGSRRGFGANALQYGGRIFAMISGGRLVLKLPRERVTALIERGDGLPFDAGKGRPMREWVALETGTEAQWLSLAGEALAYSSGLPR